MKFTQMMSKEVKKPSESKPQQEKKDYYDYDEVEAQVMMEGCKRRMEARRLSREQNKTNK